MSFACFIWDYPAPADSAEVELIRRDYDDVVGPAPNPRYLELMNRLTARYPDCIEAETEEELEKNVWSDGPLTTGLPYAMYSLGILTRQLDKVYPFVCETANALGLNVYNDLDGITHRADGTVMAFNAEDAMPKMSREGVDITALRGRMNGLLRPIAETNGFRQVGRDFVRGFEGGWQTFGSRVREWRGRLVADVHVDTYVYEVMRLYHAVDPGRHSGDANGRTFTLSVHEFVEYPMRRLALQEPHHMEAITRALLPVVGERLMPAADRCRTLEGLDRQMNGRRPYLWQFPLNHMIVARLVCSVDYDHIPAWLREAGVIDDQRRELLGVLREALAMHRRCDNEMVMVSAHGPTGASVEIMGPR